MKTMENESQIVRKHVRSIFKEGELKEDSVYSILEYTAADGKVYKTRFYNLDAIISVGYRVNSVNATAFRRWATGVLRNHLLQGYSVNRHLIVLQENMDKRKISAISLMGTSPEMILVEME